MRGEERVKQSNFVGELAGFLKKERKKGVCRNQNFRIGIVALLLEE